MLPASPYTLNKTSTSGSAEGSRVHYTDITWSRSTRLPLLGVSLLTGVFAHNFLRMSRWWYFVSLAPFVILTYMDRKFVPYGELESFYKYVYERRKAENLFKIHEKEIDSELVKMDKDNFYKLKDEMTRTNSTLYEVLQDLDELYLVAAIEDNTKHTQNRQNHH